MEINSLYPFVIALIAIGILLGVGVVIMKNVGDASQPSVVVTAENVTFTSDAGKVAHADVKSVQAVYNATAAFTGAQCTIAEDDQTIGIPASARNGWHLVNYTYRGDSPTETATDAIETEVRGIGQTWLAIVVIVIIVSIILAIVFTNLRSAR